MTLLAYLLKVILVSAILFGYYRLFLRNKRFHHYNRFFLLSAFLLSIVLPFIRIPLLYQPENPVNDAVYRTVSVINTDYGQDEIQQMATTADESVFTLVNSIYLLYAIGVLFLLTLVVKSLLYIRSLRKRYPAENITSLKFYNTREPGTPFSFFRSVFWNDQLEFNSIEGQQIFRHELFHVQHQHSADRLLAEVLTALFWFNPFFHLIKKELKAIHEFLADQFAISDSDRYAYATLLVQQALESGRHAGTNHFFQNHIKRRIAMITQFKQSNYGYWSRVMVLPLSIILFCFVTLYAKKPAAAAVTTIGNILNEDPQPNQDNRFAANANDTIPKDEKQQRALRKKMLQNQAHLEQLKKQMVEHEILMKKVQGLELEQLKKQMKEQELLFQENEANKRSHEEEMEALREKMESRRREMDQMRQEQFGQIQKLQKEYEKEAGDNEQLKDMYRQKLDEVRNNLMKEQQKMKERQIEEEEKIKDKIHELDQRSKDRLREKMRDNDAKILKQKLLEQHNEIKKRHQEQFELRKEDLKKLEKETKDLENELKREKQGSSKLFKQKDSLLTKVIRHYLRNLRYPAAAIEKGAEGSVYFSVSVDKNGILKDFVAYDRPVVNVPVKDIVIVSHKKPYAVTEEKLDNKDKEELFKEEVRKVSARNQGKPIIHPEERRYYFKAIFKMDIPEQDKNLSFQEPTVKNEFHYTSQTEYKSPKYSLSTSSVSHSSTSSATFSNDQDTIPAKRATKPRATERAKPAKEAKESTKTLPNVKKSEFKSEKIENRKMHVAKAEKVERKMANRKVEVAKRANVDKTKPIKPTKPKEKIKSKPKKVEVGGDIDEQDEKDDNYFTTDK
jgi:beta-lactamase regulating signal transducer with metallopeptidase domain